MGGTMGSPIFERKVFGGAASICPRTCPRPHIGAVPPAGPAFLPRTAPSRRGAVRFFWDIVRTGHVGARTPHVRNGHVVTAVSLRAMAIFNRRNALLGWLSWVVAKQVLRRKAREVVPGTVEGSKRPNKSAIAAGLAAVAGVLLFWRRKRSDDDLPPPPGE